MERAREHWRRREYQIAERLLRRAADRDPRPDSLALLGEFLLATSFPGEAEEIFRNLHAKDPQNPDFLVSLARSRADQDRFLPACRVLKTALDIDPIHAEGLGLMAEIGLRMNRAGTVTECLNRLVETHSQASEPYLVLSKIHERQNRLDRAVESVQRGLEALPADPRLLNHLGILHFRLGRFESALRCYDRALEKLARSESGPSVKRDRHILANRANALCMVGRADESIDLYKRILDAVPTECVVAINMAISLRKTGRLPEARRVLERFQHANTDSLGLLYWLGVLAAEDNSLHQAEQYLRRALAFDSDDAAVQMQLSCVLKRLGRADEAIEVLDNVLFLEPDREDGLQIKAELLLDLDRLDEAAAVYERLLERYPDDPLLCQRLGTVQALAGRLADAKPILEQALDLDPRNKGLYLDIAQISLLDGNRTDCVEMLSRGIEEGVLKRPEIRACAGLDEIKDSDRYRELVGGSLLDFADPWNGADKRLARLIEGLHRSSPEARERCALWRELGSHGTLEGDAPVVVRQILREVSASLVLAESAEPDATAHVEIHPIGDGLEISLVMQNGDAERETAVSQALFRKDERSYLLRFQNQEPTIV